LSGTIAEEASCHTAHEAAHESRSEQQTKAALPRAWPHDKDKDGSREHRDGDRPWSTALRPHRLSSGTAASALTEFALKKQQRESEGEDAEAAIAEA